MGGKDGGHAYSETPDEYEYECYEGGYTNEPCDEHDEGEADTCSPDHAGGVVPNSETAPDSPVEAAAAITHVNKAKLGPAVESAPAIVPRPWWLLAAIHAVGAYHFYANPNPMLTSADLKKKEDAAAAKGK